MPGPACRPLATSRLGEAGELGFADPGLGAILDRLLHDVRQTACTPNRFEVGRHLDGSVARDRLAAVLSQPLGYQVGQVPGLDPGRATREACSVQRSAERGVQLPAGSGGRWKS